MRNALLTTLLLLLVSGLTRADTAPTPTPPERLREIEREIRSHQDAADEDVQRMREKAKQITKDAQDKSDKIRAEADAYTKKIEREIEEIRKRGPDGWAETSVGVPTRKEMTDLLASLIDPLLACWQPVIPPSARPKPDAVEKCVLTRVRERFAGRYGK